MTNYKLHKVLCVYADTGGSGSGNQGNDYKIVKAMHNGCEYEFGGGSKIYKAKLLMVGGGGGGSSSTGDGGHGGGGGGAVIEDVFVTDSECMCVIIGNGGAKGNRGGDTCVYDKNNTENYSKARGGAAGLGSSGGASGNGYDGGTTGWGGRDCYYCFYGAGGGGAGGAGCGGCNDGGRGGQGICGMGGGGAGGQRNASYGGTSGIDGGGASRGNATGYGGGGGGGTYNCSAGTGYQGMVEICYKTDGSCGFTSATGGQCCYTCNGYCVHRFTSNGTFTIGGGGHSAGGAAVL